MEKYSVLMSVYYKEKTEYLKQSIESILNQTVTPDEFVIVCDGPLGEELDGVLMEYAATNPVIKLLRLSENVGLGRALNAGLCACTNNIVARMDSDDISMPDRMERELLALVENDADIVSGTVIEFSENIEQELSRRILPVTSEGIRQFSRRRNPFNHPAVMFRKESVEKAGGYKDFMLFEDYHLWLRMLASGAKGYNIEEPLLYMRADSGLYDRRGGFKYAAQIFRFRWYMLTCGHAGIVDFIITAFGHAAVALVPSGVRRLFYERMLRK